MSASLLARTTRTAALFALVSGLGACSWFTDFKEQPKIDPWETPSDTIAMRGNPQNSVSVYGTAVPGFAISRTALPGTVDSMSAVPNPVPADARSLHNGRMYYQINCAVCHGEAGKGFQSAAIAKYPIYAPPLVGASAENRADGYIWGIMRNGRGAMPSYNRIEELDRWDVVNYVRGLQGKYQVAIGPVGLPGETGDKVPGYTRMGPTRPSPYFTRAGSQAGPGRGMAAGVMESAQPSPAAVPDSALAAPVPPVTRTVPAAPVTPAPTTTKAGGAR